MLVYDNCPAGKPGRFGGCRKNPLVPHILRFPVDEDSWGGRGNSPQSLISHLAVTSEYCAGERESTGRSGRGAALKIVRTTIYADPRQHPQKEQPVLRSRAVYLRSDVPIRQPLPRTPRFRTSCRPPPILAFVLAIAQAALRETTKGSRFDLEHRPRVISAAIEGRAVEIAGGIDGQAGSGTSPVPAVEVEAMHNLLRPTPTS